MNSFSCLYLTLLECWRSCSATKKSGYSAHQSSCINSSINLKQAPDLPTLPHHSGLLVLLPLECYVLYIVQSVTVEVDNRSGNGPFFKRTHCSVLTISANKLYLSVKWKIGTSSTTTFIVDGCSPHKDHTHRKTSHTLHGESEATVPARSTQQRQCDKHQKASQERWKNTNT